MGEPPLLAGVVKLITALPLPVVMATAVGAPGTGAGVTELLAPDAEPVPALLVAVTVKV